MAFDISSGICLIVVLGNLENFVMNTSIWLANTFK